MMRHLKQEGVVIVTALLTVALVAVLCAVALRRQDVLVQKESSARVLLQGAWITAGASEWMLSILREDGRANVVDYIGESWSVPVRGMPVEEFVTSRSDESAAAGLNGATIDVVTIDLQSRINIYNLVEDGRVDPQTFQALLRLFAQLKLPATELRKCVEALLPAIVAAEKSQSGRAGAERQETLLLPRTWEQLEWLGLSVQTLHAIKPYVVILPERTPVNLNTAPAPVLHALIPGLDLQTAQRFVQKRSGRYYKSVGEAMDQLVNRDNLDLETSRFSVKSSYFEIKVAFYQDAASYGRSVVVHRDGLNVTALGARRFNATRIADGSLAS